MIEKGTVHEKKKQHQTLFTIIQSCFIFILITLVILMMTQINRLQGTARVINYAGLVRGATQRLVKLELTANPNDELIFYLDEILADLKYGDGDYKLVNLDDEQYHQKLDALILYWDSLKGQITQTRANGYEPSDMTNLLAKSETYFKLADETVSAAEVYSEQIAKRIELAEFISAIIMCLLCVMIIWQTFSAIRMFKRNQMLAQKAYIDMHTGLMNKNKCEELLNDKTIITTPTACLMFDMNNLKQTNDTYGHLVGDKLIADFAQILKSVIRETDFAGRCGGDEFLVILYNIEENTVSNILSRLVAEIECFNSLGKNIPISYAHGWSISTNYPDCTVRKLFQEADRCMYTNKRHMKEHRQA